MIGQNYKAYMDQQIEQYINETLQTKKAVSLDDYDENGNPLRIYRKLHTTRPHIVVNLEVTNFYSRSVEIIVSFGGESRRVLVYFDDTSSPYKIQNKIDKAISNAGKYLGLAVYGYETIRQFHETARKSIHGIFSHPGIAMNGIQLSQEAINKALEGITPKLP